MVGQETYLCPGTLNTRTKGERKRVVSEISSVTVSHGQESEPLEGTSHVYS